VKVADFLSPASTLVEARPLDKPQLLGELAERAARAVGLDAGPVVSAILAREELGSTGVGGGVAIPHARLGGIDQPHGLLVRLKRPIDFAVIRRRSPDCAPREPGRISTRRSPATALRRKQQRSEGGAWFEAERRERPARSRWCKSTAMKE